MREAQRVWEKHEQPIELLRILEENFLQDSSGACISLTPTTKLTWNSFDIDR